MYFFFVSFKKLFPLGIPGLKSGSFKSLTKELLIAKYLLREMDKQLRFLFLIFLFASIMLSYPFFFSRISLSSSSTCYCCVYSTLCSYSIPSFSPFFSSSSLLYFSCISAIIRIHLFLLLHITLSLLIYIYIIFSFFICSGWRHPARLHGRCSSCRWCVHGVQQHPVRRVSHDRRA